MAPRSPAESSALWWARLDLFVLLLALIPEEKELLNPKNWCIKMIFGSQPIESCLPFSFSLLFFGFCFLRKQPRTLRFLKESGSDSRDWSRT